LIYAAISLPIFHAFAAASFRQALRRFRHAIAADTPPPPHAAYASADFHAFAAELFLFAILFSPCRFSAFHFHAAAIAATPISQPLMPIFHFPLSAHIFAFAAAAIFTPADIFRHCYCCFADERWHF
jgi:hypothetical protein